MLVHRWGGNVFPADKSGTVVPLLTGAASTPWHPSHARAADFAHNHSQDSEVWRVFSPTKGGVCVAKYKGTFMK